MSNRTKRTTDKAKKFLEFLKEGHSIEYAASQIGVGRTTVYEWKETDEKFSQEWEDAYAEGTGNWELEGRRRAVEGYTQPIFHEGNEVGEKRIYSDSLFTFFMKARDRERFSENFNVNAKVSLSLGDKMAAAEARVKSA